MRRLFPGKRIRVLSPSADLLRNRLPALSVHPIAPPSVYGGLSEATIHQYFASLSRLIPPDSAVFFANANPPERLFSHFAQNVFNGRQMTNSEFLLNLRYHSKRGIEELFRNLSHRQIPILETYSYRAVAAAAAGEPMQTQVRLHVYTNYLNPGLQSPFEDGLSSAVNVVRSFEALPEAVPSSPYLLRDIELVRVVAERVDPKEPPGVALYGMDYRYISDAWINSANVLETYSHEQRLLYGESRLSWDQNLFRDDPAAEKSHHLTLKNRMGGKDSPFVVVDLNSPFDQRAAAIQPYWTRVLESVCLALHSSNQRATLFVKAPSKNMGAKMAKEFAEVVEGLLRRGVPVQIFVPAEERFLKTWLARAALTITTDEGLALQSKMLGTKSVLFAVQSENLWQRGAEAWSSPGHIGRTFTANNFLPDRMAAWITEASLVREALGPSLCSRALDTKDEWEKK